MFVFSLFLSSCICRIISGIVLLWYVFDFKGGYKL
nr:MAG TPA: envelope glycoprotein [Caudoviricetes sp.]